VASCKAVAPSSDTAPRLTIGLAASAPAVAASAQPAKAGDFEANPTFAPVEAVAAITENWHRCCACCVETVVEGLAHLPRGPLTFTR